MNDNFKVRHHITFVVIIHLTPRWDATHLPAMQDRSSKRPREANQLVQLTAANATGGQDDFTRTADGKNAAAVMLGRRGGLKGGAARAQALSAEERKSIASRAAAARWSAKKDGIK